MALGNRRASVSQPSTDAKGPILLYNPPLIYTRDCKGKSLTKSGQEPDLCCKVITRVFVPADHGLLTPEGHEAPPAPVATREGPWRRNSLDVSAVVGL